MDSYDVVIIDSGINLNNNLCVHGICIEKNNDDLFVLANDNLIDKIGHGTIIYSIINKYIDVSKIFVIKLSEHQNDYDESYLFAALEYVKQNVKCKIINISLGFKTSENIEALYRLCNEITEMGVVIVSAFDNEGCYSYPAAFDCVIGVDSKGDIKHINEYDFVENSPINVLAKGNLQRLKTEDGKILLVGGSSIACAHITTILASRLKGDIDLHRALSYLKANSTYIYAATILNKNKKNAVVFPFAKEAHAFVRFDNVLPFHIENYYDIRPSGKVGRQLASYYEGSKSKGSIMDVEQIDFTGVDAIILGHLDELNKITKRDYKLELIKKAIALGVNIYSFDSMEPYEDLLNVSGIKYFYPQITQSLVPQNTFGKLYKIPKPVVGIFGTSSQQGKFSLQITLKSILESYGYDVGAIGTEPHSLLFKFDSVFPMGYNCAVHLHNHDIVLFLNNEINKLCMKGKEIIIVASQAAIIPYCGNNLREFPSMQYHFALGTKPDAIIICVNYFDEVSYIKNSIFALIGLTDATIVALVMYPLTYSDGCNGVFGNTKYIISYDEYEQRANILYKEFQIPVFLLGNEKHMNDLSQEIIDFFN